MNADPENFLERLVTQDETWVPHFDPKSRVESRSPAEASQHLQVMLGQISLARIWSRSSGMPPESWWWHDFTINKYASLQGELGKAIIHIWGKGSCRRFASGGHFMKLVNLSFTDYYHGNSQWQCFIANQIKNVTVLLSEWQIVSDDKFHEMPQDLLQDNVPAYKSQLAMNKAANCGFELLLNPPYSPNMWRNNSEVASLMTTRRQKAVVVKVRGLV